MRVYSRLYRCDQCWSVGFDFISVRSHSYFSTETECAEEVINSKSGVRCWQYQLSSAQKVMRCATYHLGQKISECICFQRGRICLKFIHAYGNISSTSALKVQESTKDLETECYNSIGLHFTTQIHQTASFLFFLSSSHQSPCTIQSSGFALYDTI